MKKRNGFTLVEILIVVVILGILAAIVVPQFSDASEDAKLSSLMSDLQTMRSQIQLYKIQHNGDLPGTVTGVTFEESMTKYTNQAGSDSITQAPAAGVYGPYLQQIPDNQFCDANGVEADGTLGGGNYDWNYNTTTGAIHPDDADHLAL